MIQNISSPKGRTLRKISTPALRNIAGNKCCRARKIDDEAMNSAKHIRQRCRATRRAQAAQTSERIQKTQHLIFARVRQRVVGARDTRGLARVAGDGTVRSLLRNPATDLFR